jgi:hypothetical protein
MSATPLYRITSTVLVPYSTCSLVRWITKHPKRTGVYSQICEIPLSPSFTPHPYRTTSTPPSHTFVSWFKCSTLNSKSLVDLNYLVQYVISNTTKLPTLTEKLSRQRFSPGHNGFATSLRLPLPRSNPSCFPAGSPSAPTLFSSSSSLSALMP